MTHNDLRVRILVVDDDVEILQVLKRFLELDPRIEAVATAETGAEALRVLGKDDRFDVILSDERLPDIRGVQVLAHARHAHPGMVRILFSGYRDQEAAIKGINEARIHQYVEKPVELAELTNRIFDLVERRELDATVNGEIYLNARSMAKSIHRRRQGADPAGKVDT
ncbi:MAG: response regulator [Euryarchaeota archaeon]|nr:response regulator [Euryarchaeota archaeon]